MMRTLFPRGTTSCNDFQDYDASIIPLLFEMCRRACNVFCNASEKRVYALFAMALYAVCLRSDGLMFKKKSGNPSGWLLTIFLNTLVLILLISSWVFYQNPEATYDVVVFWIRCLCCGDDSVISVHPDCPLNLDSAFSSFVSVLGMTIKELSNSVGQYHIDYCGSSENIEIDGVLCRTPRYKKFLDELLYSTNQDPAYYYQRALNIYAEAWTHYPTRVQIRGLLELLVAAWPWLTRTGRIPTDYQLRYLHTGLE